MKTMVLPFLAVATMATPALADTAAGQRALALAALVAEHSPSLGGEDKYAVVRLFEGGLNFPFPANRKITVQANAITCRASNVDITSRSCTLTFGGRSLTLTGRRAHGLFATLVENGVPEDGAAGSVLVGVSNLTCTIDPAEIKQKAGGGADCKFDRGAAK